MDYKKVILDLLEELSKRLEDNTNDINNLNYAEQLNNYLTMGDKALRNRLENMNAAYVSIVGFLEWRVSALENMEKSGLDNMGNIKQKKNRRKNKNV